MMVNPQVPISLMSVLHERYINVESEADIRINQLTEVIADIKEPIIVLETPQVKEVNRMREVKVQYEHELPSKWPFITITIIFIFHIFIILSQYMSLVLDGWNKSETQSVKR